MSVDGHPTSQLVVPERKRLPLLHYYHYNGHRGYRPLLDQVSKYYYWPNMALACLDVCNTCSVCNPLKSRPLQRVAVAPIPTPSLPFSVIHVDHKGVMPRSGGKYYHIMVVTCALTRYTRLIPCVSVSGDETLRLLNHHIFSVFGAPAVLVTDNGPAFVNSLMTAAANFYGYRHVHILPYNAQANGTAESSVKRIKELLDKHCKGYTEWHATLPEFQRLLNCTTHSTTGVSPHRALFGYDPLDIAQLENPSLFPELGDGDEYLKTVRSRLITLHDSLRRHSDAIKKARADEANARQLARVQSSKFGTIQASTPGNPKYVWILHGSVQDAAKIRKSGHGTPWKYKYKVIEVRPHSVRLEVPTDGSVPRINSWQLRRRVVPASEGEHSPGKDAPTITESGLRISPPPRDPRVNDPGVEREPVDFTDPRAWADDDQNYEVDCVTHATIEGGRYKIFLKYRNSDQVTWRWRNELLQETSNPELLREIRDESARARARYEAERGRAPDVDPVDEDAPPMPDADDDPEVQVPADSIVESGRPTRERRRTVRYEPTFLVTSDGTCYHDYLSLAASAVPFFHDSLPLL
jgi:hypothetical protein